MVKKTGWFFSALGGIALSIAALFLPIIIYETSIGDIYVFNAASLVLHSSEFTDQVLCDYIGTAGLTTPYSVSVVLVCLVSVIGVVSILVSLYGVVSLSKQRPAVSSFYFALLGLIGTAIPSVIILILFLFSRDFFRGTIMLGPYAIVTPAAMILSCVAVTRKRQYTKAEQVMRELAHQYIRPAGDL